MIARVGNGAPRVGITGIGAYAPEEIPAANAAAYDRLAGCTGFIYALSQGYGAVAAGLPKRALVVWGDGK